MYPRELQQCEAAELKYKLAHVVTAFNTITLITMELSDWLIAKLLLQTIVNNAGCYVQICGEIKCQIMSTPYAKLIRDPANNATATSGREGEIF